MPQPKKGGRSTTTADDVAGTAGGQAPAGSTALVPAAPPDTPASVWQALDLADEAQILEEIVNGTLVDKLAYEFEAGTGEQRQKVRGLSYTGVNWCVREMAARGIGRIGIKSISITEGRDPDGNPVYEAIVVAEDKMLGTENAGMADAPLYPTRRGGGTYTDPHAKRKALSKAQRNAKAGLVPELLKAELLARVTSAQLEIVQTARQQAELEAGQKAKTRARQTTAAKPSGANGGPVATAAQQRMLYAKFREGGGDELAREMHVKPDTIQRAVFGWIADQVHADRIPKAKVDQVVDAMGRIPDLIDAIATYAVEQGNSVDHQRARWLLEQLPELATALNLAPAQDGEQQAMGV